MSSARWEKLRALPCFEEVESKLRSGTPPPEVADFIQQERKEYLHASRSSLITVLYEYRRGLGAAGLSQGALPDYVRTAKDRIGAGFSELEEYEILFRQQQERIEAMIALERKLGFQNPKIDNAMRVASELLQGRHKIKMELSPPGHGRNLGTLSVRPEAVDELTYRYGEKAREALLNPESRAKVLGIYQLMVAKAEMEKGKVIEQDAPKDEKAGP